MRYRRAVALGSAVRPTTPPAGLPGVCFQGIPGAGVPPVESSNHVADGQRAVR